MIDFAYLVSALQMSSCAFDVNAGRFASTAQHLSSNSLSLRAGAYHESVHICASKDMDEAQELSKPEIYKLSVEQLQSFPAILQSALSLTLIALRANGVGMALALCVRCWANLNHRFMVILNS